MPAVMGSSAAALTALCCFFGTSVVLIIVFIVVFLESTEVAVFHLVTFAVINLVRGGAQLRFRQGRTESNACQQPPTVGVLTSSSDC